MRKFLSLFLAAGALVVLNSCEESFDPDNVDVRSIAPRIESFSPEDGTQPLKGDTFNISATFEDGELSPLSSATLTLWQGTALDDPDLTQLQSITESLSGTSAEVVWDATAFESFNLDTASYIVTISVSDSEGSTAEANFSFEVISSLYTANNTEMYVAGSFNGWAETPETLEGFELELIDDNTWSIDSVAFNGGGWKFKNTVDWSDQDWGDSDCDGVMENTTGGGPDTECGFDGLVNITFNDETLEYTIELLSPPASNIDDLFLLGNFNNFIGSAEYQFDIDTNNTWVLEDVLLSPGDLFLFSEASTLSQDIWGDNEAGVEEDSIADAFGSSIEIPEDFFEGFYTITFVDITRRYYVRYDRPLCPESEGLATPDQLFLVGGSTGAGWNPGAAIEMEKIGDLFRTYQYLTVEGDGFKFLPDPTNPSNGYEGDYGVGECDVILQEGEGNATIDEDGFYRIDVDFGSGFVTVTKSEWGIIGDATGSWDDDTDMSLVSMTRGETQWTITMELAVGNIKFRENNDWSINYGDANPADGSLVAGGGDIPIRTAGNYTVTVDLDSDAGYSYTVTAN